MARQKGIMPISGKVGDLVFTQSSDGGYCRAAQQPYKQSEGTKKSSTEFGTCSSASKMVRNAFKDYLLSSFSKDPRNRLQTRFQQVIGSGPKEKSGFRGIVDGDVSLIVNFEFNPYAALERLIDFKPPIELKEEQINLALPEFGWQKVTAPKNACGLVLGTAWGFFDFDNGSYEAGGAGELVVQQETTFQGAALDIPLPRSGEHVFLMLMTASFITSDKQGAFRIGDKKWQAGKILSAIHLREGKAVVFKPEEKVPVQKKNEITPNISWKLIRPNSSNDRESFQSHDRFVSR